MQITTQFDIGDKAWAVWFHWLPSECQTCHGQGGATIPNTGAWVECEVCDGKRVIEGSVRTPDMAACTITRIDVLVCLDGKITETYDGRYRQAVHPQRFSRVFRTEEEAAAYFAEVSKKT